MHPLSFFLLLVNFWAGRKEAWWWWSEMCQNQHHHIIIHRRKETGSHYTTKIWHNSRKSEYFILYKEFINYLQLEADLQTKPPLPLNLTFSHSRSFKNRLEIECGCVCRSALTCSCQGTASVLVTWKNHNYEKTSKFDLLKSGFVWLSSAKNCTHSW